MGSYYWIKVYHEVLHDPKMGRLDDHLWRRFFELCLIAGEEESEGWLPSVGDMAWTLRTTPAALEADLLCLRDEGLVHENDARTWWCVTRFADRQAPLSAAERKAKQRERDRQRDYDNHGPVTQGVTIRDTEQDTDTDTEKIQRQRQTTDGDRDADAAECLRAVLDLGITEPKASQLVRQASQNEGLDALVQDLRDWIGHYKSTDGVTSPIGLAITQVESGVPPPFRASGRRGVAELPY